MNIVNRFHAVRPLGVRWPEGIGPRMILERRRSQWPGRLVPDGPEWVHLPSGLMMPAVRGGVGGTYLSQSEFLPHTLFNGNGIAGTQTTSLLNANYVFGTSGPAYGARFKLTQAETLSEVRVHVLSYTGTPTSTLLLELRSNSFTTGPSTTVHESQTLNPASATGWIVKTGWSFSLSANTVYWLVVGDPNGAAGTYATMLRYLALSNLPRDWKITAASTSDGWQTGVATAPPPAVVLKFTSGRTLGSPFTTATSNSNNSNKKGLRFLSPTTFKVWGALHGTTWSTGQYTNIQLWADGTGPSGSPLATGTYEFPAYGFPNGVVAMVFETPPTCTQGAVYRLVYSFQTTSARPNKISIGTGADATLRSCMLGSGAWYYAESNATTDWSNDDTNAQPSFDVLVDDYVPVGHASYHAGIL